MHLVLIMALVAALVSLFEDIRDGFGGETPDVVAMDDIERKSVRGAYLSIMDASAPGLFIGSGVTESGVLRSILFPVLPYEKSLAVKNGDKSVPLYVFIKRRVRDGECDRQNNYCLSLDPTPITGLHDTDPLDSDAGYLSDNEIRLLESEGYRVRRGAIVIEEGAEPMGLWGKLGVFVLALFALGVVLKAMLAAHARDDSPS